jgi:oleandomycin transport system permease protein
MTATTRAMPGPLAVRRRIGPVTMLRHTLTLAWRNLVQIKHNPMEHVDLSIQPIMFVVLFAYIFGPPMAGSVDAYLPIIIPGIIAQNALFMTMSTGFGMNVDITKGVFDRLRSLPIARTAPLTGRILADTLKQAWSMAILLGVGYLIGFRITTGVLGLVGAFALLLTFAVLVSWVSVYVGLVARDPEKVQIFGFILIFPLTFTSNAFIPMRGEMPGWLETWIRINPVSELVSATRGLLLGNAPVAAPALHTLLWGLGIAAVFIPLCLRAFKRRG